MVEIWTIIYGWQLATNTSPFNFYNFPQKYYRLIIEEEKSAKRTAADISTQSFI